MDKKEKRSPLDNHYRPKTIGNKMDDDVVFQLDVGGTRFHASRSVLTAVPDSMLESMFSGRFPIDTQADGSVFIDRHAHVSV